MAKLLTLSLAQPSLLRARHDSPCPNIANSSSIYGLVKCIITHSTNDDPVKKFREKIFRVPSQNALCGCRPTKTVENGRPGFFFLFVLHGPWVLYLAIVSELRRTGWIRAIEFSAGKCIYLDAGIADMRDGTSLVSF